MHEIQNNVRTITHVIDIIHKTFWKPIKLSLDLIKVFVITLQKHLNVIFNADTLNFVIPLNGTFVSINTPAV